MNYELIFIIIQKRYFKKSSELIDYFAQIHLESASSLPCCIIPAFLFSGLIVIGVVLGLIPVYMNSDKGFLNIYFLYIQLIFLSMIKNNHNNYNNYFDII